MRYAALWACVGVVAGAFAASPVAVPPAAAAAHSPSDLIPAALVLRGSTASAAQDTTPLEGGAPTVLRGSPRSIVQPNASPPSCPPGFEYDATFGCVAAPSYAYGPDYGWWPYDGFGFGGFGFDRSRNRGLRRGLAHVAPKGRIFHAGARALPGFAHAFAHSGGLGHR